MATKYTIFCKRRCQSTKGACTKIIIICFNKLFIQTESKFKFTAILPSLESMTTTVLQLTASCSEASQRYDSKFPGQACPLRSMAKRLRILPPQTHKPQPAIISYKPQEAVVRTQSLSPECPDVNSALPLTRRVIFYKLLNFSEPQLQMSQSSTPKHIVNFQQCHNDCSSFSSYSLKNRLRLLQNCFLIYKKKNENPQSPIQSRSYFSHSQK